MPEYDYLDTSINISSSGTIDLDDFYRLLSAWCKQYGYDFIEQEYKEIKETGDLFIRWKSKRKVTDYIVYTFEMTLTGRNMKTVMINKKQLTKLDLNFTVLALVVKDYEDVWSGKPFRRFIRECYDKFVLGGELKKMEDQLISDLKQLQNEVKKYLELKKAE